MQCDVCPVRGMKTIQPCIGDQGHTPVCDDVRRGMPGRAEQLKAIATGVESRSEAEVDRLRIALEAELCEWGSGACGCGQVQRDCGHPDPERPRKAWFVECIKCKTDQRLSSLKV